MNCVAWKLDDDSFVVSCQYHGRHASHFLASCFLPSLKMNSPRQGGCDGAVVTWDGLNKKKLSTLPKCQTSISALAFNHDGSELAIASSYTFEEGERDHPRDEIFVREMLESDCQPKTK